MSAIDTLSAGGGGDTPESQLKAMVTITDNWLTTAGDLGFNGRAEAQKIIIWSGDAHGHDADDPPAGYYPTLDATIGALTAQGIMVFALNSSGEHSGLDEIYHGRYQASEITAATGGMLFNNVGSGGSGIEEPIVGAITCVPFDKDDGIEEWDCRSPGEEITYTISWYNDSEATLEDTIIVDELPAEVYYRQGFAQYDPNDPFNPVPPDPAYDPDTHTYTWQLGDVVPDEAGFAEITVVVTEAAQPGMRIENVAKMISAGMMVGWASHETLICCWDVIDPNIIYVDKNATGTGYNTGVDWQNAYTDLQSALYRATNSVCAVGGYTIYVAEGTYRPGDNVEDTFMLPANVSVYGGFKTGGSLFEQRNPDIYETVLTGFIGPDENNHIQRNETIVTMANNTLLDGFAVTQGALYGIYGNNANFTIENCKVVENMQKGLYAENGDVIVKWSQVENNKQHGIHHVGAEYTLLLENCRIIENNWNGIYCNGSMPTIENCVIARNGYSDGDFFGTYIYLPSDVPVLYNNTIAYNANEGILWVDDFGSGSDPNVLDYPDIQNCILWYNNDGGEQLYGYEFTQYSCVFDPNDPGGSDYALDAYYNFSGNPGFAYEYSDDPNVALNVHLAYDSPCIDMGSDLLSYTGQLDIDAEDRVVGNYVDIGADEVYSCDDDLSEDDIYNEVDWTADGVVNMYEYGIFAAAWLSVDPNNPLCDPDNSNYVGDPNEPGYISEGAKLRYSTRCDIDDDLDVDMADLDLFCGQWLWMACWKQSRMDSSIMMMGMGAGAQSASVMTREPLVMETPAATPWTPEWLMAMGESEQVSFVMGIYAVLDYIDARIQETPPNTETLYELQTFLLECIEDIKAARKQELDLSGSQMYNTFK